MSNILHIKDAYFELPEKCKDDIGCMVTMLDIHLHRLTRAHSPLSCAMDK